MFRSYLQDKHEDLVGSSFLLTINYNKSARTPEEVKERCSELREGLRDLLNDFDNFIQVHRASDPYGPPIPNIALSDVAQHLSVMPRIEVGTKKHMVHSHTLMKWQAPPKYRFKINLSAVRQWIEDHLGIGLYVNAQWVKSDQDAYRYIEKQQTVQ